MQNKQNAQEIGGVNCAISNTQWPELSALALLLADEACRRINELAPQAKSNGMPYKQQCTLELLIEELQRRV